MYVPLFSIRELYNSLSKFMNISHVSKQLQRLFYGWSDNYQILHVGYLMILAIFGIDISRVIRR
jgi:hypothetical protein